ncbi:BCLAF1 and THRAP3 family member 3 [Anomaloglossus baeobatrachus]|uniref:BCLAF1 and THRAP3 family member 3 n=1 Tax=Anomaloglossus baeobatrachus TaxID=238106 RepID=UPI003F504D0A
MAKSRSRSPRWKSRPPAYRSPEHNRDRHFQERYQDGEGFNRDPRRPIHWEEERHGQSHSRMTPYKRFNDKSYAADSFSTDLRKSPFKSSNRLKRVHSPDRRGDGRRFSAKYPEDNNRNGPREHRDYHQRNQEPNAHPETNGFKPSRREDTSHRSHHREPNWDWHDHKDQWNQDHSDSYLPAPRRRSEEFMDQNSFHKRHHDDHEHVEHESFSKRARDSDRQDYRPPPPRHSHWNDDHVSRPYHEKNWSKDIDLRDPSPVVYHTNSGELTKIEYDYSHRSPSYVHTESHFSNDHDERPNRYEDKKNFPTRTSQHNKSNTSNRERGIFSERPPEQSTKFSERNAPERDMFKTDNKHPNHKHMETGRKAEYRTEPSIKRHLDNHSPKSSEPTIITKISSEKEPTMANLDLTKSVDKYRQPHEHWHISKDIQPKSHVPQGKKNYEQKRSENDIQKRINTTSNERQMSQDLIKDVRGKDAFHPVFDHLSSLKHGGNEAPNSEFTQEIITIIHEVKANHFKSPEMSLHERFSKLQAESNKEEMNLKKPTAQPNPEIHRRIDISLEDLQNKALHKTEVTLTSHRIIEDPNDLRHDIERRRRQRLHSEEDSGASVAVCDSDAPNSYYKPQNNYETGEYQKMSRGGRPAFRRSAGRPPGSSYRGNSNQFFSSRSHFEHSDEVTKAYKGWNNPTSRM